MNNSKPVIEDVMNITTVDMKNTINNYRFFVDSCALMHEKAHQFFYGLVPILTASKKKIIIPHKGIIEIERLEGSHKPKTKSAARKAAGILKHYLEYRLADIRGEENDPFADNVFHYVFSKFRTRYDLALLTQNRHLAMEILALKESKAIKTSKDLIVLRIGEKGDALIWDNHTSQHASKTQASSSSKRFRIFEKPRSQRDRILDVGKIPEVGDYIQTENYGRIRLQSIIGEGGEGRIFSTDSGYACKIYFRERLTENRYKKLILMTGKNIDAPGVCWPLSLVTNRRHEFVGYLMRIAEGKPMQNCIFSPTFIEKNFPRWTRKNLVSLSITWLEKVIQLHNYNILIGDVNPLNFMVKSDTEIYFVDTDSYQIEDFPCPVGMAAYTAPEIQGRDFKTFLRIYLNEYFSIATLLFMILMPGKSPYSHKGGSNPTENIRKGEFPYPFGEKTSDKTPDGPWRYIWSHLPYRTKEAFRDCFTKGKRIRPVQWLKLMKAYKAALEKGYLDADGESNKIFPIRFKHVSDYAKDRYGEKDSGARSQWPIRDPWNDSILLGDIRGWNHQYYNYGRITPYLKYRLNEDTGKFESISKDIVIGGSLIADAPRFRWLDD